MIQLGYDGRNGDCSLLYNLKMEVKPATKGAVAMEATTKHTKRRKSISPRARLRLPSL